MFSVLITTNAPSTKETQTPTQRHETTITKIKDTTTIAAVSTHDLSSSTKTIDQQTSEKTTGNVSDLVCVKNRDLVLNVL